MKKKYILTPPERSFYIGVYYYLCNPTHKISSNTSKDLLNIEWVMKQFFLLKKPGLIHVFVENTRVDWAF